MNFSIPAYLLLIASTTSFIFTKISASKISALDCTDKSNAHPTKSMPGGIKTVDRSSPLITGAAQKLQNEINVQSPPTCQVKLKEVLHASTQVVSGVIIRLKVKLCPKGGGCKKTHCKVCSARIFENLNGNFIVQCFVCDGEK